MRREGYCSGSMKGRATAASFVSTPSMSGALGQGLGEAAVPVWEGHVSTTGELVPDAHYPDPKTLLATVSPMWDCSSIMGDVCNLAATGDSVLACAIFAETGPGAIGCGLILLIISWYGCREATQQICG